MWRTFILYWICLVAVHIMLLALVCACKGVQGPLDLLCECMYVSFFDLYDHLCSTWAAHLVFFFFCGAAVSPAAFCLSRLRLCKSKEEEERRRRWWWRRRRGEMDRSREVGGRERSVDRLWESQGFYICWVWTIALFLRLALGIYHIYIFSSWCSGVF